MHMVIENLPSLDTLMIRAQLGFAIFVIVFSLFIYGVHRTELRHKKKET